MDLWLLFVPACFALNAAPGPNNVTAFVAGARMPLGAALFASVGRVPAFMILIAITAIGLGAALAASATAFWIIKILGAAYLVYVGVKMWRAPAAPLTDGAPASAWRLARQDFLVAIGNPKAIAIFTAFFPQFVDVARPIEPQILEMGAVFIALEALAATLYVLAGRLLRGAVRKVGGLRLLQKGVGGFLVMSGLSLAASSR